MINHYFLMIAGAFFAGSVCFSLRDTDTDEKIALFMMIFGGFLTVGAAFIARHEWKSAHVRVPTPKN